MTFNDFNLGPDLSKALEDLSFQVPTPVQEGAIPFILSETGDLIALAQTGTGKTAAFGLPLLSQLEYEDSKTQILILCPTRELCLQITRDLKAFAKYMRNPGIVAVYGGSSYNTQISQLKRGARIVVATPGRLKDLIDRGFANLRELKCLVLDEADEMLNLGFREELEAILTEVNPERRTLLFSATFSPEVSKIASGYMRNPEQISFCKKNSSLESIEHLLYIVKEENKYQALKRLADFHPEIYGIVFCKTRNETKDLSAKLIAEGYNAEALHGDLSQDQREYVMEKFRTRAVDLLLATDIAARGLDIPNLTHVIHYDIPGDLDNYTHRSGRTGRAGKTGVSLALATPRERLKIRRIESTLGRKFTEKPIPGKREIESQQLSSFIRRLKEVPVDNSFFETHLKEIMSSLSDLEKEDLVKRFLSLEFNNLFTFYKDIKDISIPQKESGNGFRGREDLRRDSSSARDRKRSKRATSPGEKGSERLIRPFPNSSKSNRGGRKDPTGRGEDADYRWMTISLGKQDKIGPMEIISLINRHTKGNTPALGKIEISKSKTRFQIDSRVEDLLVSLMHKKTYKGKALQVFGESKKVGKKLPA